NPSDVWTPRSLANDRARNSHNLLTVGRLQAGVTSAQAQAEFAGIVRNRTPIDGEHQVNLVPLPLQIGRQQRPALYALAAAVGVLLLIACANVTNLLSVRGTSTQSEIVVRLALGAPRSRIVGQLLMESLLLGLGGGVLGLLLALGLCDVLRTMAVGQLPRL